MRYSTEKPMQNELRPGKAVGESVASSVDYTGSGRSVSDIAYLLSLCARVVSLSFAAYLIGVYFCVGLLFGKNLEMLLKFQNSPIFEDLCRCPII